jgi:hypothetical protein
MYIVHALLLLGTGPASAHPGVFSSTGLHFQQDVQLPVVSTSWGFLKPRADGWSWLCPEALGQLGELSMDIDQEGRWWIGGLGGIWMTEDQCSFREIGLSDHYVTSLDIDATGIWATTATGDLPNSLWLSTDGGETFQPQASLGPGARIFSVARLGDAIWLVGWRDGEAFAWYGIGGGAMAELPLDVDSASWYEALAVETGDPETLWLASRGEAATLLRIHADGSIEPMLLTETMAVSILRQGEWLVVGSDAGLYVSEDDGGNWEGPLSGPEAACLEEQEDMLYACTHNWNDGAAVMQTDAVGPPSGWQWTPVLSFGEVDGPIACPQDSATQLQCSRRWDAAVANAGFYSAQAKAEQDEAGCSGSGAFLFLFPPIWMFRRLRQL